MTEFKTPAQALMAALILAAQAPTDRLSQEVAGMAEVIAAQMSPDAADEIKALAAVALEAFTPAT